MLNYLDILDRANSGPYIAEQNWDLEKVAMTTRRLVKKYKLTWDKNDLVTDDASLSEAIFSAGYEMAVELGSYSRSTERIIELSQDEIDSGIRNMPQAVVMGEGKDARTLYARHLDDERAPLFFGGSPGTPIPEKIFLANVISYMQEPLIDLATCGTLVEVDGREVRTGNPIEIVSTRRELQYMRQGLKRVGRAGMGMLAAQSSVSELGDLAAAHPDYLRKCDSHLVPMLNELKMDHRNISRAVNSLEYGMVNASLPCVIVGGLGGGPAGSAVINVASYLIANLTCLADYHILHPIHVRHIATSTRDVLWVINATAQAFARHAPSIIVADIYPKSGTGTKELLYETAANAIVNAVSGGHLEGVGAADGNKPNCSGLEARLMAEVALATHKMKMSRKDANALVLQILPKYEHVFELENGNLGKSFEEVYDLQRIEPLDFWQKMYEEVRTELKDMGLKL
ncbi:MAG: monomethylamine:corrinoid methyltransferase [Chloroflexota bacterium]